MDVEHRELLGEWGSLKDWLIKNRQWFRLSPGERAAVPEGARFSQIETRLDELDIESHVFLKAMRPTPATSVEAAVLRLRRETRDVFLLNQIEALEYALIARHLELSVADVQACLVDALCEISRMVDLIERARPKPINTCKAEHPDV
jgi:DNA-directed RNA polymerase specialized sigma24 family protein